MDQLVIYRFDSAMGKLTHHASVNTNPGAGPRHLAFHPNNRIFYAANELDCTVTVYDFDTDTCALSPRQTISTLPAGAPQNTVADLHLSADGKRLYASNRGHDSIAVYDVNNDGSLSLVAIPSCGGKTPRNFALAPGGRFVLTANQDSNQVNVLPIVADSHGLGSSITSVEVMGASCVVFA
jgi:6-phosphogluconolactonase